MTAQQGRDLLLKVDVTHSGSFGTVAGLRSKKLSFSTDTVDVTTTESLGHWRELLEGGGVRRASIAGAGIFKDALSDETVRATFFDGLIHPWQVVIPDFGTVEGPFQITSLEYGGTFDGEVVYEMALESAGLLTFTAAA